MLEATTTACQFALLITNIQQCSISYYGVQRIHDKWVLFTINITHKWQVKSFVDDLITELGTVSSRVALLLRSAEVKPVFSRFKYPPFLWKSEGLHNKEERNKGTFNVKRCKAFTCVVALCISLGCASNRPEGPGLRLVRSGGHLQTSLSQSRVGKK